MGRNHAAKLTEDEKSTMRSRVSFYLARHVISIPEPPQLSDFLPLLAQSMYSGAALEYWHALHNWWLEQPPGTRLISKVAKLPEETGFTLRLHDGHVLGLQVTEDDMRKNCVPVWDPHDDIRTGYDVQAYKILPPDLYEPLYDWATESALIMARIQNTMGILDEVIELASTVGQLHRMVPDLIKYVYSSTKEALAQQERRSPLPGGWMAINRREVRDALDHLALCHILPEAPDERRSGVSHAIIQQTLAIERVSVEMIHYHARHHIIHREYLSSMKDGVLVMPEKKWAEED